jgi:hypothetical protein
MSIAHSIKAEISAIPFAPPKLWAYGDPDDHLRLTVLLADAVRQASDSEISLDTYDECMDRGSSWTNRLNALVTLLGEVNNSNRRVPVVLIVDPDALDPAGPTEIWDDRSFVMQRRSLLEVFLTELRLRTLEVRRVHPSSNRVTEEFKDMGKWPLSTEPVSESCRPIFDWLRRTNKLSANDIKHFVSIKGRDLNEHVVAMAFDCLPESVREVAKRLVVLRGPQRINGGVGPFFFDRPRLPLSISENAVKLLMDCGFLQLQGGCVEMPRVVREYLKTYAEMISADRLVSDHQLLGNKPIDGLDLEQQLEVHYHAVAAGDLERAKETARYYGADLRELGYRLSIEERYEDAAKVYDYICTEIDQRDAYAWEYYAFNKARAVGKEGLANFADKILEAFEKARMLDQGNPLYHGRLLGFRAEIGENILTEFHEGMELYRRPQFHEDAVTYFAEPVINGLDRGDRAELKKKLLDVWGSFLSRFPRLFSLDDY